MRKVGLETAPDGSLQISGGVHIHCATTPQVEKGCETLSGKMIVTLNGDVIIYLSRNESVEYPDLTKSPRHDNPYDLTWSFEPNALTRYR
ncbi:hypothetical protein PoB_001643600 [Plakobranchus ocellatus]|uniref:Uncharacterized protein n=1 Tax=Plakobranchus ocellatus TaxID=259542 RepID=A0AAV3YS10_9GAST|nr:hypothetical protein PoB_001643600 [Plakobranchus ocellatus]